MLTETVYRKKVLMERIFIYWSFLRINSVLERNFPVNSTYVNLQYLRRKDPTEKKSDLALIKGKIEYKINFV